jgi:hypothetical protein
LRQCLAPDGHATSNRVRVRLVESAPNPGRAGNTATAGGQRGTFGTVDTDSLMATHPAPGLHCPTR